MNNLITRTISGIIFLILVVGSVTLSPISMSGMVLLICTLGVVEFSRMFPKKSNLGTIISVSAGSLLILTVIFLQSISIEIDRILTIMAGIVVILLLLGLFLKNHAIQQLSSNAFAFIWIAGGLTLFISLGWFGENEKYLAEQPLLLLIMIWVFDVSAYLTGSLIGKHRLAPRISPGKSWEGFFGGMVMNALAAVLIYNYTGILELYLLITLSVLVSISSTAGDLLESKLKRIATIKDSGQLIPGHGGILDRFDSLLFAAPVYYITLQIFQSL